MHDLVQMILENKNLDGMLWLSSTSIEFSQSPWSRARTWHGNRDQSFLEPIADDRFGSVIMTHHVFANTQFACPAAVRTLLLSPPPS